MLFGDVEINSDMRRNLDDFLRSTIIGKNVDFISKQRENPNPYESCIATPTELTEAQALDVLRKTNQQIWG